YIIEDDYDSEFRFKGKPIPALAANDAEKVIYIGSFSKSVTPAIRVSFMVLPETLLHTYQSNCGHLACTVSRIDQIVLQEFIESGSFSRYLNKMRKRYKEKHDLLLSELKPFQSYYDIYGMDAGLHILLRSKTGLPEKKLVELAEREGIKVYALSQNCRELSVTCNNTVLLGFGKLTEEEIKQGIEALERAWL
ncbi:MAG: PLP-dependent aminotransferase family protein, partial [Oscillospiraceae bacterium]|nr:PLP-dependent aminotransferase family protein [Oscillospiraceae bacterium]